MTYGIGNTFTQKTVDALQISPFSLNIDESTSNNNKRILAILASYFCTKQKRVLVEHLKSVELIKVDTKSVLHAIDAVFSELSIPWNNLVSILMDSCAVMRGSKNGLEVKIRQGKAPQLLDIDGDSCHHIHNACKKFCGPFEGYVEGLATDLHNDLKWSADLKQMLVEVCEMLDIPFTTPQRFLAHRWLSCYDITAANNIMMDAFRVFYYGFLTTEDKKLYKSPVRDLLGKRNVSTSGMDRMKEIWHELSNKKLTEDGQLRKERIIEKVIVKHKQTELCTSAVLKLLKEFVLLFQKKSPMIHLLHDAQEQLLRDFMACFVKAELVVHKSAAQLKAMNPGIDEGQFSRKSDMFVGIKAEKIIKESHSKDIVVMDFLKRASTSYIQCATHMQKKLPLDNAMLRAVSAIDPDARGHNETVKCLKTLRDSLRHFLSDDDVEKLSLEVHRFQVDTSLPSLKKA
ncbi:uncharacterized protein LOC121377407 [Gigantopelta aegis]|uniref:uncharacterized protein LOC121377407 n=1 Tax=Gigantopelta aegis TaxID=1735272 RepID=UPI001B88BA39|nr:uncharacterized protein LOC121377407 [Gigantopelta aegis]